MEVVLAEEEDHEESDFQDESVGGPGASGECREKHDVFDHLCAVVISDHSLYCYHSEHVECEWITSSVGTWLQRTSDHKKALERFRSTLPLVRNYFNVLWPGVAWTPRQSKFLSGESREGQGHFFRENTIPTSVFTAYILLCTSHPRRQLEARKFSVKAFQGLVHKLISTVGEVRFSFRQIQGSQDPRSEPFVTLTVTSSMMMETENLFVDHVRDSLEEEWDLDRESMDKPWIYSSFERITLQEWLAFCLDPSHKRWLAQLVLPNTYSLLTQIAYCIDTRLCDLAAKHSEVSSWGKKRLPVAVSTEIKRSISEELWKGKDSCLQQV